MNEREPSIHSHMSILYWMCHGRYTVKSIRDRWTPACQPNALSHA